MKDNQVNEILFDLYMVDEDLKKYENELKDIILEIYYSRPDTEFDEGFKQNLKEEVLIKIKSLKRDNLNRKINLSSDLPKESNILIFMKKFNYILGGAGVSTLAILTIAYFMIRSGQISLQDNSNKNVNDLTILNTQNTNSTNKDSADVIEIANNFSIKNISSNAFGKLTASSLQEAEDNQRNSGGGASPKVGLLGTSEVAAIDPKTIAYNSKYYTYTYSDSKDKLNYDDKGLEVLKRIPSNKSIFNTDSININGVNLLNFKNLTLNNISLDENTNNGYSIYYNANDGSLSINKNWQKWTTTTDKQLKISDIPSNEAILKISNDFIANYSIDTKNYGTPEVDNSWKTNYEKSTDKENYYLSNIINVTYPLIINGKPVYESYGNRVGMIVSVDIVNNKVDSVYGIQSQNYESSKYDLETDTSKILEAVKVGGFNNYRYITKDTKEVILNVNNPTIGYVRSYRYDENNSYELFIPAMIFTINNTSKDEDIYRENIVIPLTKEAVDEIITNSKKTSDDKAEPATTTNIDALRK
ncbi:MAG: hypothetical protein QMB51_02370 [Patescibacteria group bacterium]